MGSLRFQQVILDKGVKKEVKMSSESTITYPEGSNINWEAGTLITNEIVFTVDSSVGSVTLVQNLSA